MITLASSNNNKKIMGGALLKKKKNQQNENKLECSDTNNTRQQNKYSLYK